ncbi:MAG: hypothetical protein KDA88_12190 [Planctomycetaceae bacterium]|nr:hypothetical protein [Planctomycetaceae bacterium]MCB9954109.1 hypothetical protein [Planctomycetaceae bacterium]
MARSVLICLVLLVTEVSAEVTGDLSLLTKVGDLQQANIQAIQKWTGQAEIKIHTSETKDDYDFTETVAVEFAYDAADDATCFSWLVTESFARKRGHDDLVDSLKGYRAGALQTKEDYFNMSFAAPDPRTVTVMAGGRVEPVIGGLTQSFYPMSYFRIWHEESDKYFARKLKFANEEWMHTHVSQEGDLVILDTGGREYPKMKKRFVFDLSKSGLLVEFKGNDLGRGESQTQEYELVAGVYLPVHTVYRNALLDGSEVGEKEVHWTNETVNEPIPESAFSLEAMGVPAGANVRDSRSLQSYRFTPSSITSNSDDSAMPNSEGSATQVESVAAEQVAPDSVDSDTSLPSEQGQNSWLIVLLGLVLGLGGLTWWIRKG